MPTLLRHQRGNKRTGLAYQTCPFSSVSCRTLKMYVHVHSHLDGVATLREVASACAQLIHLLCAEAHRADGLLAEPEVLFGLRYDDHFVDVVYF